MPILARFMTILILSLAIFSTGSAWAHTWYIAKGIFGDFRAIQSGVNAAASGDTIRIGPGRFYDVTIEGLDDTSHFVGVEGKNLTFIGAEDGSTIIGHEDGPWNRVVHGIYLGTDVQSGTFRHLTFDGFNGAGIHCSNTNVTIENCSFSQTTSGIVGVNTNAVVETCTFSYTKTGINFSENSDVIIRNCFFTDRVEDTYPAASYAISLKPMSGNSLVEDCTIQECWNAIRQWGAGGHITVRRCTITGGVNGLLFWDEVSGRVQDCSFIGQQHGIYMEDIGKMIVQDCHITMDNPNVEGRGVSLRGPTGHVVLHGNIMKATDQNCLFYVVPVTYTLDIRNNHFMVAGLEAVYIRGNDQYHETDPVRHLDFSNNWWGTTNTTVIEDRIVDINDNQDPRYVIDYQPILEAPVATESTNLGGLKALFR